LRSASKFIADSITARLASHADAERAVAMSAYMRDQFTYYGVDSPTRKQIERTCFAELTSDVDPFDLARVLWKDLHRECVYVACELLRRTMSRKKQPMIDPQHALSTLEHLIVTKSWWDTIDTLSPNTAYPLLTRYPGMDLHATARRWINDDNIWLQRSAILVQLKAKAATDADLLFELILRRIDSREFFIRKGAGWALREYSKTDPARVRGFLDAHRDALSVLTYREASKYC